MRSTTTPAAGDLLHRGDELDDALRAAFGGALLLVDIDGFSRRRIELGVEVANRLARLVGARLMAKLRGNDDLIRVGEDRFAVVLRGHMSINDATMVAGRLAQGVTERPLKISGDALDITVTIGVVPVDHSTTVELLRLAEMAVRDARQKRAAIAASSGPSIPNPAPRGLPLLPSVLAELAMLPLSDDAAGDIETMAAADPALAAHLLRLAARGLSPLEHSPSIGECIVKVGAREVLKTLLNTRSRSVFLPSRRLAATVWEHATLTASWARAIADETRIVPPGSAYVGGLLHDVGRLLQLRDDPRLVDAIEETGWIEPAELVNEEHRVGIRNHAELGAELGRAWGWAPELVWAIEHHHDRRIPKGPEGARALCAVIRVADVLAARMDTEDRSATIRELLDRSEIELDARVSTLVARWEAISHQCDSARARVGLAKAA